VCGAFQAATLSLARVFGKKKVKSRHKRIIITQKK
jgi:hypothetical protein